MGTWNWKYLWTMWKTTHWRRGLVLQADSNHCRTRRFLRMLALCLETMVSIISFNLKPLYIQYILRSAKLEVTVLSCVRWFAPKDVRSLAEVRSWPQRTQSRADLQTSPHTAAAAGPRQNRYSPQAVKRQTRFKRIRQIKCTKTEFYLIVVFMQKQ